MSEGEWGKPPVDEYGRPLYGDVFGQIQGVDDEPAIVDKTLWGQLEEEIPESDDDESEGKKAAKAQASASQSQQQATGLTAADGTAIVVQAEDEENEDMEDDSGITSVSSLTSGMETPDAMQLRKKGDGTGTETPDTVKQGAAPRQLYTVLEEKKAGVGGSLFGSAHSYVVPPPNIEEKKKTKGGRDEVTVPITADDISDDKVDAATLKRKFEEAQLKSSSSSSSKASEDGERATKKQKTDKDKEKSRALEKGFRF
jgi:splicing factor 3B subunit 2